MTAMARAAAMSLMAVAASAVAVADAGLADMPPPHDQSWSLTGAASANRDGSEADEAGSRFASSGEPGGEVLTHGRARSHTFSQATAEHSEAAYMESIADSESQSETTAEAAFVAFLRKYKRTYKRGTQEYEKRRAFFVKRFLAVRTHNAKPNKSWKAGIGRFADFTEEERRRMRGWRNLGNRRHAGSALEMTSAKPLPSSISWTHLKTSHNIKDQASCGSCWAITTISVLEAHFEINHGIAKNFSAQQLLDCTPNPNECGGQGGCKGATVELGMEYILKNGIAAEEDEPYLAEDKKCSREVTKPQEILKHTNHGANTESLDWRSSHKESPAMFSGAALGLHSWATLTQNADHPLAEAVVHYGPVGVSASAGDWFEYEHGIFNGCQKDTVVDHAITLYGYGVDKAQGKKYWLIRNSWGTDWGEKGFIRLLRHDQGEKYCGTDDDPAQGTGCKGGPAQVTVCGMCGVLYDSVVPYFKVKKSKEKAEHSDIKEKKGKSHHNLHHGEHNSKDASAELSVHDQDADGQSMLVELGSSSSSPGLMRRELESQEASPKLARREHRGQIISDMSE